MLGFQYSGIADDDVFNVFVAVSGFEDERITRSGTAVVAGNGSLCGTGSNKLTAGHVHSTCLDVNGSSTGDGAAGNIQRAVLRLVDRDVILCLDHTAEHVDHSAVVAGIAGALNSGVGIVGILVIGSEVCLGVERTCVNNHTAVLIGGNGEICTEVELDARIVHEVLGAHIDGIVLRGNSTVVNSKRACRKNKALGSGHANGLFVQIERKCFSSSVDGDSRA